MNSNIEEYGQEADPVRWDRTGKFAGYGLLIGAVQVGSPFLVGAMVGDCPDQCGSGLFLVILFIGVWLLALIVTLPAIFICGVSALFYFGVDVVRPWIRRPPAV